MWHIIPDALEGANMFSKSFPKYNYNWIVPTIFGTLTGVCIKFWSKIPFMPSTSSVPESIKNLHERGYVPCNYMIPMFITSLVSQFVK
jgi:hypothetical protein